MSATDEDLLKTTGNQPIPQHRNPTLNGGAGGWEGTEGKEGGIKTRVEDGHDVAKGTTADAAATDPSQPATEIALEKGQLKQMQGTGAGALPVSGSVSPVDLKRKLVGKATYQSEALFQVTTLAAGESFGTALVYDRDNALFAAMNTTPARIVKLDATTLQRLGAITLPAGADQSRVASLYAVSPEIIVHVSYTNPWVITRINGRTMQVTGQLTGIVEATNDKQARPVTFDGESLYIGCDTVPGKVVKINPFPSPMTRVDATTLSSGLNGVRSMVYLNGYLYAGCDTTPAYVVKINPRTMSVVATVQLAAGSDNAYAMTTDGRYLYIGCYTSPVRVVKLDPEMMTEVATYTANTGFVPVAATVTKAAGATAVTAGTKYFVLTYTTVLGETSKGTEASVVAVAGDTITVTAPAFPVGVTSARVYEGTAPGGIRYLQGTIAASGGTLSVTTEPNPGNAQPPTTNATSENQCWSITTDGRHLYVGAWGDPSSLIQIDPVTMTRVSSMVLNPGFPTDLMFMDPYLITTTDTDPTKVVRFVHPRMATSNDVNQGAQALDANAWPVRVTGRNTQLGADQTATWANSAVASTKVQLDISSPTIPPAAARYLVIISNPSAVTGLVVTARLKAIAFAAQTRYPDLVTWTAPPATDSAFIVDGWFLMEGGRLTLANETPLGAADGFTATVRILHG